MRLATAQPPRQSSKGDLAVRTRVHGRTSLIGVIWIIVGVIVAWMHDYITVDLLRRVISVLLAIFLWFLVLLGVDLHID
jgi:hypothetical protein